ncbi:hypothetical protein [Natranaerofaba carboxydovora]|nr:hypothetical protein [Natranaerofaba carboxydovora]
MTRQLIQFKIIRQVKAASNREALKLEEKGYIIKEVSNEDRTFKQRK